jgi:hypothetical protein
MLVVTALATVLRGQPGRNAGANDDTTRHLSGRSIRVLAFGLAFVFAASRMTTRERVGGNSSGGWKRNLRSWSSGEGKANLILQSNTVCHFSIRFVLIQEENEFIKPL